MNEMTKREVIDDFKKESSSRMSKNNKTGWAIDFDNESETNGCKTGFKTREAAEKELAKLFINSYDLGPNARVRKFRNAELKDFGLGGVPDLERFVEDAEGDGLEPAEGSDIFARWDDQILEIVDEEAFVEGIKKAIHVNGIVLYDEEW